MPGLSHCQIKIKDLIPSLSTYFNPISKFKPDLRTRKDQASVLPQAQHRTVLTEPEIEHFWLLNGLN